MKKLVLATSFLLLQSVTLKSQEISWEKIAPGIWKGTVGEAESYNLIAASGAKSNMAALRKLSEKDFPIGKDDIKARLLDGKIYLNFPLKKEEQLFGFGLNFQTIHQRGKVLQLHTDHFGGKDNGRNHAPVPFYVSSAGYGIFINSARYLTVYAGTAVKKGSAGFPEPKDRNTDKTWSSRPYSDAVEILVPAGEVEFYVFAGSGMLDVVSRYNLFFGGGPIPPRWGLGFTQRVKSLYTSEEVEKEAETFATKGFPLDFIGLEPGWQSRSYPGTFEWDKTRYPYPESFVRKMLDKKIRLNLWINPYIAPQAPFYEKIRPYTSSHTVWLGLVPDFTLPEARRIFFDQLKQNQLSLGVSGYKIDEVDGYDYYLWPDVATFPSGRSAEQMRQTYGLLAQRYSAEMFHEKNKRTYGLVRASNGSGVSFPYVLYNDYYNHEDFITALINSSFSGLLWTPEVRASKTAEEWLRRIQSVVFSPMAMINAWSTGTKPWSYPEVEKEVKEMALLRMRLMPYFYSEFAKYHFHGIPVFRAMNLEEGFTVSLKKESGSNNLEENPYAEATSKEIKDQYMAGEYLLVAPMFAGQNSREVLLPKGDWFDFYTGKFAGNGEVISVKPGLDKIPVFVKDGGIIPFGPALLHAPGPDEKIDLEIRYYGNRPGKYMLYDDDGETFDYEKGACSFRQVNVTHLNNDNIRGSISPPEKGKPNSFNKIVFKNMSKSK